MRFLDILYPSKCVFCGRVLREEENGACRACAIRLPYVTEPACGHCGKPLEDEREERCPDCRRRLSPLDRNAALWVYRPQTKAAMMDFKYGGCTTDATYYADELAARFHGRIREWNPDVLVPVPIHRRREWFRGYNQAALLASALGERLRIPMREVLVRTRGTSPQKEMDPAERRNNLRQVVSVVPELMERDAHARVLLIDDVYTTGATLDACAQTLKDAGTERVYGLTLCIGSGC